MMQRLTLLIVVLLCSAAPIGAQTLKLDFHGGRVTLSARDVPIRTILAEWTRQGGTRIVNADRVPGGLVTLELPNVPERQAVEALLRGTSGYVIGPSLTPAAGRSTFESILILPASSAPPPAPARAFTPPPAARPPFLVAPSIDQNDLDDDLDPGAVPGAMPDDGSLENRGGRPVRAPRFFQQRRNNAGDDDGPEPPVQPDPDDREPTPVVRPGNPFGVLPGSARPGEITPAPKPAPGAPTQPDPN